MVKDKKPHFLFLSETKVQSKKLQSLRRSMGYEGMFHIDPIGKSGGLALFWMEGNNLEVQNFSLHHINAKITMARSTLSWFF
jgi:hypothetical protein